MHTLLYSYNNVLIHINSYMFRPSVAYHQEGVVLILNIKALIIVRVVT
jgi:hypothetical protein